MPHEMINQRASVVRDLDQDIIVRKQTIPNEFLDDLNARRAYAGPEGELMHVCSIPVAVVDHWLRQGFNVFEADARDIVARLAAEDLGAFMATSKSI